VLLSCAWANEVEVEIMHADQHQMEARQNAVCRIAGSVNSLAAVDRLNWFLVKRELSSVINFVLSLSTF
jgi:hypothetical protein